MLVRSHISVKIVGKDVVLKYYFGEVIYMNYT